MASVAFVQRPLLYASLLDGNFPFLSSAASVCYVSFSCVALRFLCLAGVGGAGGAQGQWVC